MTVAGTIVSGHIFQRKIHNLFEIKNNQVEL